MRTTYGFKNAGRKKNADPSRKGSALMPGLYKHKTCVDQLETQQKTYSFKACDRYHTPTALVGYIDKVCTHNLIESKLLCCLIVCNLLSPLQTEATLLANITPNIVGCYMLCPFAHPVACCMLGVVAQTFEPTTPNISLVAWLPKRSATMLDPFTQLFQHCWGQPHMHHHTWSPKSYGLYPSHDTLHVPTLLEVNVESICKQLPTWMQQLPTLLTQQCLDLLHPFACNFKVKNIPLLIFFQVLVKAMTFLSSVWNMSFFTHVVFTKYYMCF